MNDRLKELEITRRLKIDTFLDEYSQLQNFPAIFQQLLQFKNERNKIYLFFDVMDELEILIKQYDLEKFSGSIFELLNESKTTAAEDPTPPKPSTSTFLWSSLSK